MDAPQGDRPAQLRNLVTIDGYGTDDDLDHASDDSNDDGNHDDNGDNAPPMDLVDAAAHAVPALVPGKSVRPSDGESNNRESENEGPEWESVEVAVGDPRQVA